MNESPVLEFEDVCFAYDHEEVLHNVCLNVTAGSLVAVVGPNGGGKSTFIKLALGFLRPQRGRVRLFGDTPVRTRHRIGYVPQHLRFDPAFPVSALDVVLMGRVERHLMGPYRHADRMRAMEALERVRLPHLANRSFPHLSGGERQRVLIAQALGSEPDMLLLDEPTANVDREAEHEMYELLGALKQNITIIVVSHNLNVVTRHASHVACINRVASLLPILEMTEDRLHAVFRGDMAVLQHGLACQVIDPAAAIGTPHRHGTEEGKP
jgi:zinc transport system ATP-binding protein